MEYTRIVFSGFGNKIDLEPEPRNKASEINPMEEPRTSSSGKPTRRSDFTVAAVVRREREKDRGEGGHVYEIPLCICVPKNALRKGNVDTAIAQALCLDLERSRV